MHSMRLWHLLLMVILPALLQQQPQCSLKANKAKQAIEGSVSLGCSRAAAPEHGGPAGARPNGVHNDGVHPGGHEEGVQHICLHARALGNSARHDGAGCGCELRMHAPALALARTQTPRTQHCWWPPASVLAVLAECNQQSIPVGNWQVVMARNAPGRTRNVCKAGARCHTSMGASEIVVGGRESRCRRSREAHRPLEDPEGIGPDGGGKVLGLVHVVHRKEAEPNEVVSVQVASIVLAIAKGKSKAEQVESKRRRTCIN